MCHEELLSAFEFSGRSEKSRPSKSRGEVRRAEHQRQASSAASSAGRAHRRRSRRDGRAGARDMKQDTSAAHRHSRGGMLSWRIFLCSNRLLCRGQSARMRGGVQYDGRGKVIGVPASHHSFANSGSRSRSRRRLPSSRPENLEEITPPLLGFHILSAPEELHAGSLIEYKLRVRGVPMKWLTEIEVWEPPYRFVDNQLKGIQALASRAYIHGRERRNADRRPGRLCAAVRDSGSDCARADRAAGCGDDLPLSAEEAGGTAGWKIIMASMYSWLTCINWGTRLGI